ncbi:MAG: molybdate ABC transporter substrate-binding protein [Bacteroidetes bacterium CG2_30_32_10]|nr:MAG: molybdate ABC transporter substrate-binding protein [Bacteroidetes bacterium CG2_30_32_10]
MDEISGNLILFHAGSLSVPMKEIAAAFNKKYPKVNILMEPAGSVECARKITELNKPCDIFASADYKVIDNLLIPKYTDWNIKFAANELIIAYTNKSKYADKISKSNWYELLLQKEVLFGRADPNTDPCGYRSVLTMQLAEKYYHKKGLESKLLIKDNNYIRPKETDLIALLESNAVDYIFLYRSLAEQHKLKYLLLPDSINLKKIKYDDFYKTAKLSINGNKPGEVITQYGEPMVYGITILKDAPNLKAANTFVEFLLNKNNGMKIMESNGQPSLVPSKTEYYDKIPDNLKKYVIK